MITVDRAKAKTHIDRLLSLHNTGDDIREATEDEVTLFIEFIEVYGLSEQMASDFIEELS